MKAVDMTGRRVGRLTVECRAGTAPNGQALWRCLCDCGRTSVVYGWNLRKQSTRSCGCLEEEVRSAIHTTHGLSKGSRKGGVRRIPHPLYEIWCGIKRRCLKQDGPAYSRYGGRGIKVYQSWVNDFAAFVRDVLREAGERPSKQHSLDRIDNDGDYRPGNVRWATPKQQAENRGHMSKLCQQVAKLEAERDDLLAEVRRLRAVERELRDHVRALVARVESLAEGR